MLQIVQHAQWEDDTYVHAAVPLTLYAYAQIIRIYIGPGLTTHTPCQLASVAKHVHDTVYTTKN